MPIAHSSRSKRVGAARGVASGRGAVRRGVLGAYRGADHGARRTTGRTWRGPGPGPVALLWRGVGGVLANPKRISKSHRKSYVYWYFYGCNCSRIKGTEKGVNA